MTKSTEMVHEYATIMAEAQDAVSAITDPQLKRIAFEKLLDKLLHTAEPGATKSGTTVEKMLSKGTRSPNAKNNGPKGRIEQLIGEGFFKASRSLGEIQKELAQQGFHIPTTTLSGPLQRLCQHRQLRRRKQKKGKTETYVYSNW